MARPKFAPESTPSRGPIPKPYYLPHPWTRPTYDAKRHPDPIRRFPTMHWTDRPTHGPTDWQTDRPRESLMTIGRYTPLTRATRPNNNYKDLDNDDEIRNRCVLGRPRSRRIWPPPPNFMCQPKISRKKIRLSLIASVALAAEKYVAFEFHIFPAFS